MTLPPTDDVIDSDALAPSFQSWSFDITADFAAPIAPTNGAWRRFHLLNWALRAAHLA
jgi:hypothetical protein